MNNSLVETKKLMNLIRFPDESGKSISLEQTNSLPIPVLENGDLYAYAFYYGSKTHVPSAKVDIYPPTFIGKFDWSRCRVVWIHPTEPDHLGMGPSRFKIIGSIDYRALDDRARASGLGGAVERSRAMEDLYDRILPIWLGGGELSSDFEKKFRDIFCSIESEIYFPVYRRLGKSFFDWVNIWKY